MHNTWFGLDDGIGTAGLDYLAANWDETPQNSWSKATNC